MKREASSTAEEISKIYEEKYRELNNIHEREFRDAFEKHSEVIEKKAEITKKLEKLRDRLVSIMNEITEKDEKYMPTDFTIRDGSLYSYHSETEIKLEEMFKEGAFGRILEGVVVDCENPEHRYDFEEVFEYCKQIYNNVEDDYLFCTEGGNVPEKYRLRSPSEEEDYYLVYTIDKDNSKVRDGTIEILGVPAKSERKAKLQVENPSLSNRKMRVDDSIPSDEKRFIKRVQHLENIEIVLEKAERELDKRLDKVEDGIREIDEKFGEMIIAAEI